MPIQDSDGSDARGSDNIFTFLLIVSAVCLLLAVGMEYIELANEYNWPNGGSAPVESLE